MIGRFAAVDARVYPHRSRVIVRSGRGLEQGLVLSPPAEMSRVDDPGLAATDVAEAPTAVDVAPTDVARSNVEPGDGVILRGMTVEDELLAARLEANKAEAFAACAARLETLDEPATLIDVECLFDGRTMVFYFLGEMTARLEALTSELAELYDGTAQIRKFGEVLATGCGPDCGTEKAEGGGCSSCGTGCAVASACATRRD